MVPSELKVAKFDSEEFLPPACQKFAGSCFPDTDVALYRANGRIRVSCNHQQCIVLAEGDGFDEPYATCLNIYESVFVQIPKHRDSFDNSYHQAAIVTKSNGIPRIRTFRC